MNRLYGLIIILSILLQSCSDRGDANDIIPVEQDSDTKSVGAYISENQWIYEQMNHHYLWREDMPDSLSCDYLLDPVSFFKSLLSPKDRFSYCDHNEYYQPDTRTEIDIFNPESVLCDSIYYIGHHRIGYLCYRSFESRDVLEPIIKHFFNDHITDLILDLRYNGGGLISTCQYLCSSIVPEEAYGKLMQYLRYNDIVTRERQMAGEDSEYSFKFKRPSDGKPTIGNQLYGLRLKRLFVLVSNRSASASESTIICLRPYMEVVTIGERTVGKGVGMETFSNKKCKYKLVPITFQYYNSIGESVPLDGIEPDIPVEVEPNTNYENIGNVEEPLLKIALKQIQMTNQNY